MVTPLQYKIYHFIAHYKDDNGYSPSFTEIAQGVGLSPRSVSLVSRSVQALAQAGLVTFPRKGYRALSVVRPDKNFTYPILGRIAAGKPIEAVTETQYLDLNTMLGTGGEHFVLQVKGDSMVEDGILDNDFVICRATQKAQENDIVVALIDHHEATLKRISYQLKGWITLIPANSQLKPKSYQPERIHIQGVQVGLLRLKK
jgi:repressor LexA